jgi:hypothetical protein
MQKIFCFLDFINEFKKVKFDGSNTGRTKILHNVLDEPTDSRSYSSSVLLRDYLRNQEIVDALSGDTFDGLSKKQKFRIKSYGKTDKIKRALNNLKFLKSKERDGKLHCEYCNRGPLIIYAFDPTFHKKSNLRFNQSDGATCDHRNPVSKGGDPFDHKNLAVCCYRCNQKKSNMSWEDWEDYMKNHLKSY